jgi:DHA2 family multidrug resistance protein-like MFS transporter
MVVFLLAALLAALAPSFEALLAARVLQGLGGAAVMSLLAGMVRNIYPLNELGRAIGVNAMTVGFSSAAGPSLGAAVLAVAPWPAVFLVTLPVGLAALVAGQRFLPAVPGRGYGFDGTAAGLNVAAFGFVFLGLDLVLHAPVLALPALAAGIGCGALLVRREFAKPVPLLPLDLLRIRPVRFAVSASTCMFAAHMTAVIALPFHLSAAGWSPSQIGLLITPYPLAVGVLAPLMGRRADRDPSALSCVLGGAGLAAALVGLAVAPAGSAVAVMALLLAAGIGFAGFQAPNNRVILVGAPRARAGSAGGMQSTARVLGQATGAVLAAACFTLAGPWAAFLCGAALALAAAGLSLARGAGPGRVEKT